MKKKEASKRPQSASNKKHKIDHDDESLSDSGSEVGWDSDADQFITNSTRRQYSEEEDDDEGCEGGLLLSDLFEKNLAKTKNASKTKGKHTITASHDQPIELLPTFEKSQFSTINEGTNSLLDDVMEEGDDEVESQEESLTEVANEEVEEDEEAVEESYDDEWDDTSEDDVGDEAHNRFVTSIIKKFSNSSKDGHEVEYQSKFRNQLMPESSTMNFDENLSLSALLGELHGSQGFEALNSSLGELGKKQRPPKYIEKVISNRLERKEIYQSTKENMDKWHDTVLSNRYAPVLDLANDKRQVNRAKDLVTKFRPTTDMEREIQMVLVQSGVTESAMEQKEVELLQARNISLDEIKQRQADLAKVNALMFYEQMKRHRINKIKSKAYRSIRRKQKRREKGLDEKQTIDEEDTEEVVVLDEQNAYDRVKERMDLKHKNTSKWAKMALSHGHTDKSLRDAYHESVRLGQELTKKMRERVGEIDSDKLDDSIGDMNSASAKAELKKIFDEENGEVDGKYKKLFEMDFMKKATEQQKIRAREEAQLVLQEIEALEASGLDIADEDQILPKQSVNAEEKQVAKNLVGKLFNQNIGSGFQLNFSKPSSHESNVTPQEQIVASLSSGSGPKKNKKEKKPSPENLNAVNPWLEGGAKVEKMRVPDKVTGGNNDLSAANFLIAVPQTHNEQKLRTSAKLSVERPDGSQNVEKKLLFGKSQEELVQMAFTGPDFEADFAIHKDHEVDEELGVNDNKLKILKDGKF